MRRLLRLIGMLLFLGGLAFGCLAGLEWLQKGSTNPMVLRDVVQERLPEGLAGWVNRPRSWIGLHRFVVWVLGIPVFAFVALVGFLGLLASGPPPRPGHRR